MVRAFVKIKLSDLKRCLDWTEEHMGDERLKKYRAPNDDTIVTFVSSCIGNDENAKTAEYDKGAIAIFDSDDNTLLIQ